ncbi:type 2 isopentenyl-diphosphate Delta-isomerase [Candidatus Micrarchaeota archaeon]|nr:type 2 isopentenyl-diphosphate Delta-isomerase [Candidatus Micrarchaeota archaeon]
MGIKKRKGEHIEAVLKKDVEYEKSAGFECVRLLHNALPEIDCSSVELKTTFLGKKATPLMITAITGGFERAVDINKQLAETAEKYGLPLGLGSMRPMLEGAEEKSYLVREHCPSIPLVGNIGIAQLASYPVERVEGLVSKAELDGMAVHLNPLQEVLQPEGDKNFSKALELVEELCEKLSVPVIAKETGAGINKEVALKLKEAGVSWIDVAGAGGTSWSRVEYERGGSPAGFEEWGIPTVTSILMCKGTLPLIGSGGVRSGIDAVKAIALGAEIAGASRPFLLAYDYEKLDEMAGEWVEQMKIAAFLTGCKNYGDLKKIKHAI